MAELQNRLGSGALCHVLQNSFFIATVCMLIEVTFSSLAAYAFAKMNFFGKNVLFVLFLGTMMIPGEVMLIPNYMTMVNFGWIDTYYALIVPGR